VVPVQAMVEEEAQAQTIMLQAAVAAQVQHIYQVP
jgi:hypothetical protein